jgi:hypothetical protein
MKKLLAVLALVGILILPILAHGQRRLSPDDQRRFDSYYTRWQQYRRTNNRSDAVSMERRMQDVYAHYGIAASTPYSRIASGGQGDRDWDRDRDPDHDRGRHRGWDKDHDRDKHRYRDKDHDRDRDHDRDGDRDRDKDHGPN